MQSYFTSQFKCMVKIPQLFWPLEWASELWSCPAMGGSPPICLVEPGSPSAVRLEEAGPYPSSLLVTGAGHVTQAQLTGCFCWSHQTMRSLVPAEGPRIWGGWQQVSSGGSSRGSALSRWCLGQSLGHVRPLVPAHTARHLPSLPLQPAVRHTHTRARGRRTAFRSWTLGCSPFLF